MDLEALQAKLTRRNLFRLASFVIIASGLVYYIWVTWDDAQSLQSYEFSFNPFTMFASFIVTGISLTGAIYIWHLIIQRFGATSRFSEDYRIYSLSLLGTILPGGIWSAVSRATMYDSRGVSGASIGAAAVIEFFLQGIAGLIVWGVATMVQPTDRIWQSPWIAGLLFIVALLLIQPPLFNRAANWLLRRQGGGGSAIQLQYRDLLGWILAHTAIIFCGCCAIFLVLVSFIPFTFDLFWPTVTIWAVTVTVGNLLFWLPGTPLIRDGVMVIILSDYLPATVSLALVIILRIWTLIAILLAIALSWGAHWLYQWWFKR